MLAKQACYTRSVPSRQGRTFHRKVTKFFCPTFCVLQKVGKEFAARRRRGRGAAKDLIGLVRSCSFVRWFEVCKTSELPWKVLIVAVRSCGCGVLIRGLQNLGAPCEGDGFILFALCKKNQKAHQRFANLWTPGTIQSSAEKDFVKLSGGSCRNRFCLQNGGEKALNRCERVTVVQTQDRCFSKMKRCTASSQNVFTDEIYCCTLALVQCEVVAVVCWKKFFLYRIALHELKKFAFFANQKVFVYRKLYALPSKASRFRNQNRSFEQLFTVLKNRLFMCKNLLFAQTFSCYYPKQPFSTLHLPFAPPLTYCL